MPFYFALIFYGNFKYFILLESKTYIYAHIVKYLNKMQLEMCTLELFV